MGRHTVRQQKKGCRISQAPGGVAECSAACSDFQSGHGQLQVVSRSKQVFPCAFTMPEPWQLGCRQSHASSRAAPARPCHAAPAWFVIGVKLLQSVRAAQTDYNRPRLKLHCNCFLAALRAGQHSKGLGLALAGSESADSMWGTRQGKYPGVAKGFDESQEN